MTVSINTAATLKGNERSNRPEAGDGDGARGPGGPDAGPAGAGDLLELSVIGRRMGTQGEAAVLAGPGTPAAAGALLGRLREQMLVEPSLALAAQAGQAEPRLATLLRAPAASGA